METALIYVGAVFGLAAITTIACIYYAWALVILWEWFAVPFGLPPLTMPWAIGVTIVVGFLTKQDVSLRSEFKEEWGVQLSSCVLRPLFALGIGYVAKQYM